VSPTTKADMSTSRSDSRAVHRTVIDGRARCIRSVRRHGPRSSFGPTQQITASGSLECGLHGVDVFERAAHNFGPVEIRDRPVRRT